MRLIDLTGRRIGKLVVLRRAESQSGVRWRCRCDCGRERVVFGSNLARLHTTSCGCLGKPNVKPRNDLVGRRFGRLIVLEHIVGRQVHGRKMASTAERCLCDCGNEARVNASVLLAGRQVSCGCHLAEMNQRRKFKPVHGESRGSLGGATKTYRAWCQMRNRCLNPRGDDIALYAGRGIRICQRWLADYEAFRDDIGQPPTANHSLDRIDPDGHYSCGACEDCRADCLPANCRWATAAEQADNRRCTIRVTFRGRTQTLRQWCQELDRPYKVIHRRLQKGWAVDRAFTTAIQRLTRDKSLAPSAIRGIWNGIKRRCCNPGDNSYRLYGARGVTVCQRWQVSFESFRSDLGPRPSPVHSVGRKDNDAGYWCGQPECPDCGPHGRPPNCGWETPKEQAANLRRAERLARTIPRDLSEDTPGRIVPPQRYTLCEIASLLNIPLTTLRWHKRKVPGRFAGTRSGACYDKSVVDEWLANPGVRDAVLLRKARAVRPRLPKSPKTRKLSQPVPRYRKRFDNWYVNMNGKRYFLRVYGRENAAVAEAKLRQLLAQGESALAAMSSPSERTVRSLKALAARWGRPELAPKPAPQPLQS